MSVSDFQKIKAFIIAVEKRFKISEFGSRHGVIVYGDRAEVLVNMNKARDSTEFVNAVNSLWRIGGGRASYRALELAENVLYDFNRTRRNVPKVVVMVTAGGESRFSNSAYLYQTAKRLRERAVVIKVVGIGSVSSRDELLPLVTSSADLFRSGSFDDLKDETPSLSESMCESIGTYLLSSCSHSFMFGQDNLPEYLYAKNCFTF